MYYLNYKNESDALFNEKKSETGEKQTLHSNLGIAPPECKNSITMIIEPNKLMLGLYTVNSKNIARVCASIQI